MGKVLSIDETGESTASPSAMLAEEYDNGSQSGASYTVDWNNANNQKITLNGNLTALAFTDPSGPGVAHFQLMIFQDATGSRTIGSWPSSVKWVGGGSAPTLSTGASVRDVVTLYWNGTDYTAMYGLNFPA